MNCPKCGQKLGERAKFCPKCGTAIPKEEEITKKPPEQFAATQPVELHWAETTVQVKPKEPKTKIYIIAAAAALVITLGCVSYVLFGASPEYRGAVSLMKSGLYSEAAAVFATIDPEYKDVDNKLAECNAMISYQQGVDFMNSGSFTEAAEIFFALGDFEDSTQLAQTCTNEATYQEAVACMNSGDYETAKIQLTALGNFEDSKTLLAECEKGIQYNQAAALLKDGQSEQAKAIFLSLGDFKDSAQMAENCNQSTAYANAKKLYESGDYEGAKAAFATLGDYSDAQTMSVKCQNYIDYNKAVGLMKSGDSAGAEKIFTSLGGFKDSKTLVLDCKYSADYEKAKSYMKQGNYTEAAKLFQTLASADYKDSKALLADCQKSPVTSSQKTGINDAVYNSTYDQAVAAYKAGNFYTAYKLFSTIKTYKNSVDYMNNCIQTTPNSGIMYQNSDYTQNECQIFMKATSMKKYYVKIYSGSTLVYEFFFNSGSSASYPIKRGTYTIKFSYGADWFGTKDKFGDEGGYYVALVKGSTSIDIQNSFVLSIGGYVRFLKSTLGAPEIDKKSISRSSF